MSEDLQREDLVLFESEKRRFSERPLSNYMMFSPDDGGFDAKELQLLREGIKEITDFHDGVVGDDQKLETTYRTSQIHWIPREPQWDWLYRRLMQIAGWANRKYGFNLSTNAELCQIARYRAEDDGHYDWHMDVGDTHSRFRKLSISVQLSDPEEYEGGDLEFLTGRTSRRAPKEPGTVLVFPSYLLHRVQPVTRGTRYSLVLWVAGPPFQ